MKRNELQTKLFELGFKKLCDDEKTLTAYNQIQNFLYSNKTPLKAITNIYINKYGDLRIIIYNDDDLEAGYNINDEI